MKEREHPRSWTVHRTTDYGRTEIRDVNGDCVGFMTSREDADVLVRIVNALPRSASLPRLIGDP